jgi:hypothetical protein
LSLDEPQQAAPEAPPAMPEPESPFGEEPPAFSGETRAFTKMSFDDLQQMAAQPSTAPEPEPERADSSLFEEPVAPPSWEPAEAPAVESPFGEAAEEVPFAAEAPVEPEISSPPAAAPAPAAIPGDLTDEQIERIARRVVQMLSADEVKKIAWEVIPDMAEMVVKERIRQLESEA